MNSNITDKKNVYVFKFNFFKRLLYLLYKLSLLIGIILIIQLDFNWVFKVLFIILIIASFLSLINALFFKSFIISHHRLIVQFFIFKDEIIVNENLDVFVKQGVGWGGLFYIKIKSKPIKSFLLTSFSIFPLEYESLEDIRIKFVENELYAGTEDKWMY